MQEVRELRARFEQAVSEAGIDLPHGSLCTVVGKTDVFLAVNLSPGQMFELAIPGFDQVGDYGRRGRTFLFQFQPTSRTATKLEVLTS